MTKNQTPMTNPLNTLGLCAFVPLCLCPFFPIAAFAAAADGKVCLVDDGRAQAVIVLPDEQAKQLRPAADLLARYVGKASGAALPVCCEAERTKHTAAVSVHLGADAYVRRLGLPPAELDADGFVIRGVDAQNLVIVGPSAMGTEFGVCELLERFLGVRWLLPGPDGDDVPECRTVAIPLGEVRQAPAFFSRQMSGFVGAAQVEWTRRNRMHSRVSFHHNLLHVFPPEKYAQTHPEFFPVRNGKRFVPKDSSVHGWQPCCSAPGSVDEAVKNICAAFARHPDMPSFSLGVNDSSGHCQCPDCERQDPGGKNFLGYRDASDRYFAWCNRIVEGVLKTYPDKVFGCLAYSEVGQAPSQVKVHERIIPFMTYDRMKWTDPALRADGEQMTRRWHEVSPVLGWYDYIYGAPYCLPRVWFHQMAEYYRFGLANGVRAMYAEAYPNWGEGPKLYVALKLQWNPQADVDQLLRDWYVHAVGPAAADGLAAYYRHWEDFWTRRILESKWFSRGGQYLSFSSPGYLADVTDNDLVRSRRWLEGAVRKAETAPQKARARLLLRAFEYYEASAYAYVASPARGNAVAAAPRTEAEALAALDKGLRAFEMAQRRERLVREFAKDPVLVHPLAERKQFPQLSGAAWGVGQFWVVADWAAKSKTLREKLESLAADRSSLASVHARAMLAIASSTTQSVSQNPSFEMLKGRWPTAWRTWLNDGVGSLSAGPQAARTGKVGVICRGIKRGGPVQDFEAAAGRYVAVASVRVPKSSQGSATIALSFTGVDAKGRTGTPFATVIRSQQTDWSRLAVAGEIPASVAKGEAVKKIRLVVIADSFAPDEEFYVDDVALYRLAE